MKNIRIYHASKYNSSEYEEIESNIYKTYEKEDHGSLTLVGITEADMIRILENISGWEPGKTDLDSRYECITYKGKKYYKRDSNFYRERNDEEKIIYVTSLMFEQEPEYGENEPGKAEISQYPLEDILDKFLCACNDFYKIENEKDPVNSYIEFVSPDSQDIKDLLSIVGKHVYNKANGEYIELIVE